MVITLRWRWLSLLEPDLDYLDLERPSKARGEHIPVLWTVREILRINTIWADSVNQKEKGSRMRVATFNVENLFSRVAAFNVPKLV